MRKFVAAVLASAAFGGTVGALATAAVQSGANTDAHTAALVQRVIDQSAEQSLIGIKGKLALLQLDLSSTGYGTGAESLKHLENIDNATHAICEADTAIASTDGRFVACPAQQP